MPSEAIIAAEHVSHSFGTGALRRQILFDVSTTIHRGEMVILTGPSGSGKTTLLTLMGALRSAQAGSLTVLGQELRGAGERQLVEARKNIGYIFQTHNLLDFLTACQNVERSLALHPDVPKKERRARSIDMLSAVGLGVQADSYPDELSGGQKQRVAVARALVSRPQIVLADEPTASLDKNAGRNVVELLQNLAKQQGCAVMLVTHDHRILDVADRILHLEDGRLTSFANAVMSITQQIFGVLAQNNRSGELSRRLMQLPSEQFVRLLEQTTAEFQQFLRLIDMSNNDAFESLLEQVLEAFTMKVGEILQAERATLFLVDRERGELWSKVAQSDGRKPLEIRMSASAGIAGHVATTGHTLNVADAYGETLFNPEVDQQTGYRTRSILCVPVMDTERRVFAVAELLNKIGGGAFDSSDERRFTEFAASIGVVLESWWRMHRGLFASRGAPGAGVGTPSRLTAVPEGDDPPDGRAAAEAHEIHGFAETLALPRRPGAVG
jgi:putative ABC transport system ATP-binding protein